mgnify:CR=1 FL=1
MLLQMEELRNIIDQICQTHHKFYWLMKKSKNVLGWEPVWTWEKACMDMRKECIENPMELLWGKNDELDQIK